MPNPRYLEIPINFSRLNQGKRIREIEFFDSIAQHIHTVLVTEAGELSFDHDFGTTVWEHDFSISSYTSKWMESLSKDIEISIKKYVNQLENIRVDVEISDHQFSDLIKNSQRIKKKIAITVKGQSIKTKQDFIFKQSLYLSPITVE